MGPRTVRQWCWRQRHTWRQQLLGQPVDPDTLEAAYTHFAVCQEWCPHFFSAARDFMLSTSEQQCGQTDLYEALGLAAEEEGDAHARRWKRRTRWGRTSKAARAAADSEGALAVGAWQAAANSYREGLRMRSTAFLREGLKRLTRKRLEPSPRRGHPRLRRRRQTRQESDTAPAARRRQVQRQEGAQSRRTCMPSSCFSEACPSVGSPIPQMGEAG